jgi:hypothetical protein
MTRKRPFETKPTESDIMASYQRPSDPKYQTKIPNNDFVSKTQLGGKQVCQRIPMLNEAELYSAPQYLDSQFQAKSTETLLPIERS